jgi:chaperonin cofactor prefoldin
MTIEGLSTQLKTLTEQLDAFAKTVNGRFDTINVQFDGVNARFDKMQKEMEDGFAEVNQKLNDSKIRDEELHTLIKFGFEAREALRETIEVRFDAAEKKRDEQIDLLKAVLRDVTKSARK